MNISKRAILLTLFLFLAPLAASAEKSPTATEFPTPSEVLTNLKNGNQRFLANQPLHRNYPQEIRETKAAQFPVAAVLNCMDSRNIPELTFDQGIGEIFALRVAGNIVNEDILGSLEYATAVMHAELIVVMGHTSCGAMGGACKNLKLGNLTSLLAKIQPAVQDAEKVMPTANCKDPALIDEIARRNVEHVVLEVPQRSPIIANLIAQKKVEIVGAMYDIRTGKVTFLNTN